MKLEKGLNVILSADIVYFTTKRDNEGSSKYDDFSEYMNILEDSDKEKENQISSNEN